MAGCMEPTLATHTHSSAHKRTTPAAANKTITNRPWATMCCDVAVASSFDLEWCCPSGCSRLQSQWVVTRPWVLGWVGKALVLPLGRRSDELAMLFVLLSMSCSDSCACWVGGRLLRTEPKCLWRRRRRSQPQQHQDANTPGMQAGPCMRERSHNKTIGLWRRKVISFAHTFRDDKQKT